MSQQGNHPTRFEKYRPHLEFGANLFTILGGIYAALMGVRSLFIGLNTTLTYLLAIGGAILVLASLVWIGYSGKTVHKGRQKSHKHKTNRIYRYPRLYIWARRILLLYSVLLVITGIYLYRFQLDFDNKIVILVARLDGPEQKYGITDELYDQLQEAFSERSDVLVIPYKDLNTPITVGQGKNYAREIGEEYRSDLVIWGWYRPTDNAIVKIYVENLSPNQLPLLSPSGSYEPKATLNDLEQLSIHYTIDSEMKALIYFLSGYVRYRAGDLDGALDQIELALSEPIWENDLINKAESFSMFGYIYYGQGKHAQAIQILTKALAIEPDNAVNLNNRGNSYAEIGEYDLAIQDYTHAITLEPTADHYWNRGLEYYQNEKYAETIEDFTKVLELTPAESDPKLVKSLLFYRGTSYGGLGRYELAVADYTKIIEMDSSFTSAYRGRCWVYYMKSDYETAIDDCKRALSMSDTDADYTYYYLGFIYHETGQNDLALDSFTKSIELNTELKDVYYYRGSTNMELGNDEQALSDFRKFIELSDDADLVEDAKKQIDILEKKAP